MEWRSYQACCHRCALDPEARICPECGNLLLRCRGFAECKSLIEPGGACPRHVVPSLALEGEARLSCRAGERVTLPLVMRNESPVGGTLFLRRLWRVDPTGRLTEEKPLWSKLAAGEAKSLALDGGVIPEAGTSRVGLVVVLGCRFGETEEDYAFAAELVLRVTGEEKKQIVQHIHVEGGHFEAGASAVVQTGPSIHEGFKPREPSGFGTPRVLTLARAEAFELREGIRGYGEEGGRVLRTVEVRCVGFPNEKEVPPPSRPFAFQTALRVGRNSRERTERNPEPNDVCLRVYDHRTGELDRERSRLVSGVHFELITVNDRLYLCSRGRNGLWVNGKLVPQGAEELLHSGDTIQVLGEGGPELVVDFAKRGEVIEGVILKRTA